MSRHHHTQEGGAPPDGGRRSGDRGEIIVRLQPSAAAGNVVLFPPRRSATHPPPLPVGADERPAPIVRGARHALLRSGLLAASLLAHSAILVWFDRPPAPLASVGEVSMSVEVVLGSLTAAGAGDQPSPSEVQRAAAPESETPQADAPQSATAEPDAVREEAAPERVVARAEPDAAAAEPQAPAEQPEPPVPAPAPVVPDAEAPSRAKPAETPRRVEPRPRTAERTPERRRADATPQSRDTRRRAERGDGARTQSAPASTASVASSGIGVGRSDAATSYAGLVAAHLARHKQFPAEARARGEQGSTTVTFSIDGGGRVTSVQLGRASGIASIDRETEAMVRRASPFPPPPGGRAMSFTQPVSFQR